MNPELFIFSGHGRDGIDGMAESMPLRSLRFLLAV